MKELRALTGARGVAAWWVVLYHLRQSLALPPMMMTALSKGYLAVDFFFLLSGFVIWLSYADRVRAGGWRAVPPFLFRRIARIWPLHLAMLGVAVGLALVLIVTGHPDPARFRFAALPAHLLLVQNWGFTESLLWNDPAWSISCEMFAYLLFPLLAMRIDWRRAATPVVLLAITAVICATAGFMTAQGMRKLSDGIAHFGLLRCLSEFVCGGAVSALWLRWRDAPLRPALLAAGMAATAFGLFGTGALPETASIPGAFAALLLVLALTADAPRNPLGWGALHYLGEISFATYLGHSLLWKTFKLAFVPDAYPLPWPLAVIYLLLVLIASAILHAHVERPAQRWLLARAPERSGRARIPPAWTTSSGATTAGPASPASNCAANGPISPPTARESPTATRSTG